MKNYLLLFGLLIILFSNCNENTDIFEENIEIRSTSNNTQPNILFVLADDVGRDACPGYEEGEIKPNMPNLESLIASGVTFENFWSAPTCSPTRSAILTGRSSSQTGVGKGESFLDPAEIPLHEFIDIETNNQYACGLIGKWHLSARNETSYMPTQMGIDYFAGFAGGGSDYFNWNLIEDGQVENSDEYITSKLTNLAIDWIDQQEKPWFLWLAYNAAHTPFHLPPDSLHSQSGLNNDAVEIENNPLPYYFAIMEAMDHEMGRLLQSLTAEELANTIIIFAGDNGTPNSVTQSPYENQHSKGSVYEGGINTPLIISGSGVSRIGEKEESMVHATDLFSTIADIAGTGTTEIHDSKSFSELLYGTMSSPRSHLFYKFSDGYTVRNDVFKLISYDNGDEELYNLVRDPYESRNLIDDNGLNRNQTSHYQSLINAAASLLTQ